MYVNKMSTIIQYSNYLVFSFSHYSCSTVGLTSIASRTVYSELVITKSNYCYCMVNFYQHVLSVS